MRDFRKVVIACLMSMVVQAASQSCGDSPGEVASGFLTSPNYPAIYPDNMLCTWKLVTLPGKAIKLRFTTFQLEKGFDLLRIYNSTDVTFETPFKEYSGFKKPKPATLGSNVTIVFRSDEMRGLRGFRLQYKSVDAPTFHRAQDPRKPKVCQKTISASGKITSPNFPKEYPSNVECTWLVMATLGAEVRLDFTFFSVEDHWDALTVYSYSILGEPTITTFTGVVINQPWTFGNNATLVFRTDKTVSKTGFTIQFTSVERNKTHTSTTPTLFPSLGVCSTIPKAIGNARIVGGYVAPSHSWPWQAAIINDGSFICGGTLLSADWVVTAAHCILENPDSAAESISVILGAETTSFDSPQCQTLTASKVFRHPQYDAATDDNDIALIRLKQPAEINEYVSPVCLPSADAAAGTVCSATGWGDTSGTGGEGYLKAVELPVVDRNACYDYLGNSFTENMICAGYIMGGEDTCQGDSGGPFVCNVTGRYALYGITSWGGGCAAAYSPGAYTRVTRFVTWIRTTMDQN